MTEKTTMSKETNTETSIFVIEDDRVLREFIVEVLETAGYQIYSAENGHKALKKIALKTPDIILTDLVMPDKDGLEVIMKTKTETPSIKIIAMSGMINSETFLSIAQKLGAQAIMPKPFNTATLLEMVQKVLTESQMNCKEA
jgi:CheY-like chemotaxis protein